MSNSMVDNHTGTDDARCTSSKLESSTKEELIRLIKKLILSNQKSKAKCEELAQENQSLKAMVAQKPEPNITADQWECMLMKQTSVEAAYQSTVEELNNIILKNTDLESQISSLTSAHNDVQEEMDALKCTNDKLMRDIELEKQSRSDMEEKLYDWEKMMTMLEKERDDAMLHLVEVRGTCQSNIDVVEDIIRSVESVNPDRDVVSEINSSIDHMRHQAKRQETSDVHSEFIQMEKNLVKRLTYLNSITASLIFERDEIKERIQHFVSEILKPDQNSFVQDEFTSAKASASLIEILAKIEASINLLKSDLYNKSNELVLTNDKLRKLTTKSMKTFGEFYFGASDEFYFGTSQPCTDQIQRVMKKSEQNNGKFVIVYKAVDESEGVKACNICLEGEQKITSLEVDVSRLFEERNKYLLKISTLEAQLSLLKSNESEIFALRSENEQLKYELNVSNMQLQIKDKEISENIKLLKEELMIKDENVRLEKRIQQLEVDLHDKNLTSGKENEISRTLSEWKSHLNDPIAEDCINLSIENFKVDDENVSTTIENVSTTIEMVCAGDSMQDTNNLNHEIQSLKEELERVKSTFNSEKMLSDEIKQKEINNLLENASSLKLHLQEQLDVNRFIQSKFHESLVNLELEKKILKNSLEKMTEKLEVLGKTNSVNMKTLLSEKESISQVNLQLESEKLELKADCSKMESTLFKLNSGLIELKESLNKTILERNVTQQNFDITKTELEFIQNSFKSTKSDLEDARVKLGLALSDLNSTNIDLDSIQRESELKLKELQGEKDFLENNLKSVMLEVEICKNEVERMKTELEKTKLELISTKSDLKLSLDQLEKKNLELEVMQAEMKSVVSDCNLNKSQLEPTNSDLENSKSELEFMKSKVDSTVTEFNTTLDSLLYICGSVENGSLSISEKSEKLKKYLEMYVNERMNYSQIKEELDIALKHSMSLKEMLETKERELDNVKASITESSTLECNELSIIKMQLKEKEEREAKIKQLVIKNKKEIVELKKKLEMITTELEQAKLESSNRKASDQNVSLMYQNLQTEYEKLEANFDLEKIKSNDLQKSVDQLNFELGQAKVKVAEAAEKIDNLKEEMSERERLRQLLEEAKIQDEKEIQAGKIQRDVVYKEKMLLESKVSHLEGQLRQAYEERQSEEKRSEQEMKVKLHELENARKDAQQSQLMGLEIADYERTVRSLNLELEEKEVKIKSLQEESQHAHQQKIAIAKLLEACENQFRQSEEQCSKMKQMLLKSKKDLADARKQEGERATNESQLRTQNEILNQLTEEQKLKIADLISESRQVSERLAVALENQERSASLMETKLAHQKKEAEVNKLSLEKLQADYEGYKVRVHSVLKLKKNNNFDETALADERRERERLEHINAQLNAKLHDLNDQLSLVTAESDQLREEQEKLIQKHMEMLSKFETTEQIWRDKLEKAASNHAADHAKRLETIQELMTQNESMARTFKEQHACVVESLRNQLDKAQLEVDRCRTRLQNLDPSPTSLTQTQPTNGTFSKSISSFIPMGRSSEERQAAEGSENSEDVQNATKLVSSSPILPVHQSNQTFVPLEVLLSQSSNVPSEAADEDSHKDEEKLNMDLMASQRQGVHLRQLLNESEATVLRLTEQAGLLKAEIRRLERNQERQTSVSNMEYLKNVVYKFLTLKNVEERLQLVPVMQTMLKLSPEEKERILLIANDPIGGTGGESSGWSSYIKWAGLK